MTPNGSEKASKIHLFSFRSPHMCAFHFTWMTFFLCFFGWFGIAPLMAAVRQDLRLTGEQVGNTIIASVVITIFARLLTANATTAGWGNLGGRVAQIAMHFLFGVLLAEGLSLLLFSRMSLLPAAVASMILFSLLVQMSEGATFSVVPFINKNAMGSVSGIVGAGGNTGAVAAGFLFRNESISIPEALLIMGLCVTVASFSALAFRFPALDLEGKAGDEPGRKEAESTREEAETSREAEPAVTGVKVPGETRPEPVLISQSNEYKIRHA